MVADPGCMKTSDCISVCPNNALYFGFGKPAAIKGKARNAEPTRRFDLSLVEEWVLLAAFIVAFLAVRGDIVRLPLLMASGTAGVTTYLVWKVWRLARDPDVNLHRFRMKYRGRLGASGWAFGSIAVVVMLLTLHSVTMNGLGAVAGWHDGKVTIPRSAVFSSAPSRLDQAKTHHAETAIDLYGLVRPITEGGFGLVPSGLVDVRLSWLHACLGEYAEAERHMLRRNERFGLSERHCRDIALLKRMQLKDDEARAYYERVMKQEPGFVRLVDDYVIWLNDEGQPDRAIEVCRVAIQRADEQGHELYLMRRLSLLLVTNGELDEGIELIRRTLDIEPDNAAAHTHLARALFLNGETSEAEQELRRAVELAPNDPRIVEELAIMLESTGRPEEAARWRETVDELRDAESGGVSREDAVGR
jgi:Flp pilus assembly protein TadD